MIMNGDASAPLTAEGRAGGMVREWVAASAVGSGGITPRNVRKFYVPNGALWGKIAQF